jgi:hypothetical protein
MDCTIYSHTNEEWEEIYSRLYAYTHKILRTKLWFRGENTEVFLKGKQVDDYVMEAITKYLENPADYNPSFGRTLVNYLKLHILRHLISNDSKSPENKLTKHFILPDNIDDEEENRYKETMYPYITEYFDEEIDAKAVTAYIEKEISDDEIAEQIYLGICITGMKRRDVIKELNITEKDFDNGMRRLNTVLKNTSKEFGIKIRNHDRKIEL